MHSASARAGSLPEVLRPEPLLTWHLSRPHPLLRPPTPPHPLQRIHEPALLMERAEALGLPVETIQSYLDSFKCAGRGGVEGGA